MHVAVELKRFLAFCIIGSILAMWVGSTVVGAVMFFRARGEARLWGIFYPAMDVPGLSPPAGPLGKLRRRLIHASFALCGLLLAVILLP